MKLGQKQFKSIIVRGTCADRPANYFIDTGSSVSIVAASFVKFIGKENEVVPCDLKLTAFSGDRIKLYGQVTLDITLAGIDTKVTLLVSDFNEAHILLGMDVMEEHGVCINPKEKILFTERGSVKFVYSPKPTKQAMKVVCSKTVIIPPYHR